MNNKIKVTIAIPAYNSEKTLAETIESAKAQIYPNKEILVYDDGSTDRTVRIAQLHGARVIIGKENVGIGKALIRLMDNAKGKYIVYLCSDDQFTHPKVVNDIVKQFDYGDPDIGIIGRFFYQYMDGYEGAIMESRDTNILTQSCCPSGMAFRVWTGLVPSNKIFVEMPLIVRQYIRKFRWTMFEYDTIKARIHPGGNTGTKKSYYTESPIKNWTDLVGKDFKFNQGFVQLKNRAPKILWREIYLSVKINPDILKDPAFWFYATVAVLVPGFILRPLSNFYRHRITRKRCKIIERPE